MFCRRLNKKQIIKQMISLVLISFLSPSFAMEVPIYDFPIKAYTQNINDFFPVDSEDFARPLLTPEYQASQLKQFYNHYYSTDSDALSPWSEQMVNSVLPVVKKIEHEILDEFDNQNKAVLNRHYAANYKEHDELWLNKIKQNMDLYALDSSEFKADNKAIATTNTFARALPDAAPDFFHLSLPGEGFPFDNLQESVIWAGTTLYIISVSKDHAWSLVLTPDAYFAWVKSSDIANTSSEFIKQWQTAAEKGLIAITHTNTSVSDKQQHFLFTGYIGAVFPLAEQGETTTSILIPTQNAHHQAMLKQGVVNKNAASLMPLAASKENMANIIHQLQNRPYGWGGAFFFNDCSQELKSIFTPFGIWLPRNSGQQAQLNSSVDLSRSSVDERISTLKEKGHPLMTIIYIGGHVMLYVGNKELDHHTIEVMTYQNVWGLSPANKDKRYVIGQSLFFPLLKYYPENPDVNSLANKPNFKLVYLDKLNEKIVLPQAFVKSFTTVNPIADL